MTRASETNLERERLIARISQMTKRAPREGASIEYLRTRCAMLERKRRDGEDVRASFTGERARPHSFTITDTQAEALARLCDKTKKNASALVRAALAHYAMTHGHVGIARTFDADIINETKE